MLYGTGFRHHCPRGDGTAFEIVGAPRGGAALLSIRPASEEARALKDTEAALARAAAELGFLREVLDRAPVLAWSHGPDGQVAWANAAYRARFDTPAADLPDHRIADAFGHVLEEVPLTARAAPTRGAGWRCRGAATPSRTGTSSARARRRRARPGLRAGRRRSGGGGGEPAALRRDADRDLRASADRARGLRQEPAAGAVQPGADRSREDRRGVAGGAAVLRDFLERLRETRQMPEQKDFASFRRKLGELEEGARSGTYEESWQLPSGKIFRVTGRPHPQGALAFLFEDISDGDPARAQVSLGARAQPGDARPDDRGGGGVRRLGDAGLRQFRLRADVGARPDGAARRAGRGGDDRALGRALRAEPGLGAAGGVRDRGRGARRAGADAVGRARGRGCSLLVAPLPDASALVVFRDLGAAADPRRGAGARWPSSRSCCRRRPRCRSLLAAISDGAVAGGVPDAGDGGAGLKDGLARGRELRALAGSGEEAGAGAAAGAGGGAGDAAAALAAPAEAAAWPPELRRAALALGLGVAELAREGAAVTLAYGSDGAEGRLTASAPAARGGRGRRRRRRAGAAGDRGAGRKPGGDARAPGRRRLRPTCRRSGARIWSAAPERLAPAASGL